MVKMLKIFFTKIINNLKNKNNWFSFIAGLSLVLAYAPFSLWPLAILTPLMWLKQINKATAKEATKQSYLFAFGWFASGISWVHVSIDQFGGMPLIISLLLMLLLCLYLAIYPALSCYIAVKISKDNKLNLWLIPPLWLFGEYLRGVIFTGFPWLSLGYSQINGPLNNFAPIIGEVGITLVMLLCSVCLFKLLIKEQRTLSCLSIAIVIVSLFISSQIDWIEQTDKKVKVALVQGNIKQELKWAPEQEWPTMLTYLDLSRANYDADIIVWPENAVPAMEPMAQDFLNMANQAAHLNNTAIITGIINYNFEVKKYFNSLIVLGKKHQDDEQGSYFHNNSNRYYKNHLLPIGEFVPFEDFLRPLAPFFNLPQSSFSRGSYIQNNLIAQDLKILPLICFEIVFAEQLSANFFKDTDILLTVSNDAWFGDSHGPHQHLEIARMRALEFGRPLIRSTNNGITAVVDHHGKISAQIPQFKQAVLRNEINLVKGTTPYSLYGRTPTYIIALIMIIIILANQRKIINNKVIASN